MLDGTRKPGEESSDEPESEAPEDDSTAAISRRNQFVRRLIPTVAAATFTVTGCLPGSGDGENDGGSNGGFDAGDVASNDGVSNDGSGGDVIEGLVDMDGDGEIENSELQALCNALEDCDPDTFSNSYLSTSECVAQIDQYVTEYVDEYTQTGGPECGEAFEAMYECILGTYVCADGYFEAQDAAAEQCFADFSYEEYCAN